MYGKTDKEQTERKILENVDSEFEKMSIKTVVKMLLKSVPLLSKGLKGKALQSVIAEDDNFTYGLDTEDELPEGSYDKETGEMESDFAGTPFEQDTGDLAENNDDGIDTELADALNVELKSGKHQGKVLGDLVESDTGYIKYIANLEKDNL